MRIEKLTEENFQDYEELTSCGKDGGCYCSFWHQKWSSMDEWIKRQKEAPELNRATILDKVKSQFHVGILAYEGRDLLGWVSVGPLVDCYWTWKRSVSFGEIAKTTAGITCITTSKKFRGQGAQKKILKELIPYGKKQGWTSVEGYPFDESVIKEHESDVAFAGTPEDFVEAGYEKIGQHWMTQPKYERSIFSVEL